MYAYLIHLRKKKTYSKVKNFDSPFIEFGGCDIIKKTRLFKYIDNFTSKNWRFSEKNSEIFHISAQNIDCSNEYPQSMFWAEIRKKMHTPVNPSFTI